MKPTSFSRSSSAATQRLASGCSSRTRAIPSGAAIRPASVTWAAPASRQRPIACEAEPPVAIIGSSTSTLRPVRPSGSLR